MNLWKLSFIFPCICPFINLSLLHFKWGYYLLWSLKYKSFILIWLFCCVLICSFVPSILGDDAMNVRWTDLSGTLDLYASHVDFLEEVAKFHDASWWYLLTCVRHDPGPIQPANKPSPYSHVQHSFFSAAIWLLFFSYCAIPNYLVCIFYLYEN